MPEHQRKKILIIVPTLEAGGSERFVSLLFNHIDRSRFDVRLLVLKSDTMFYKVQYSEDVHYHNKKNVRVSFGLLLKIIRQEKPQVVFSTIQNLNILLCFIRLIYPRFSLVMRESSILSRYYNDIKWSFRYEIPIKLLYRFADKIVCQSKDMMNDMIQHYHVPKNKIEVINNPVNMDQFPLKKPRQNKRVQLLTIARLDPSKGYDRILQCLSKLTSDFEYTIVGDFANKKLRPGFDDQVKKYDLASKIRLVGVSKDPQKYMQEADVYLHPSHFEGFPNVLLEAGATGLPVVSFKTPGMGEILIDGVNGFIVENNDCDAFAAAIERAAQHPFDSHRIREATRERFDVNMIIRKYEHLLEFVDKRPNLREIVLKFYRNKDILVNTSHNYLNKVLNALTPVFLIPYYNKMFGVEQFGVLIYIQAIVAVMIYVSDYGFIVTGTREVSVNANNPSHLSPLVSSVIVVKLLLTVVMFVGLFGVSYLNDMEANTLLLYTLTFTALTFQNFMPSWFFQGMKKNFIITLSNVVSKVLLLTLVIIFIQQGSKLWAVPLIEGISSFLFFAVGIGLAYYSFKLKFEWPSLKSLAHNFVLSKDNFLITLLSWLTTGGIIVITERFVSSQSFGYYGIFTRICYYIFIAVHQINLSVFPYISERYARSKEEGQKMFKSIARIFSICVLALLFGGLLFGKLFFQLVFDATFVSHLNEYIPTFYWLVVRIALLLANSYLGLQFFVANKNDHIYRNFYVVNVLVSVVASLALVPGFGVLGAAIAVCLGEAVMFFFLLRRYFAMSSGT